MDGSLKNKRSLKNLAARARKSSSAPAPPPELAKVGLLSSLLGSCTPAMHAVAPSPLSSTHATDGRVPAALPQSPSFLRFSPSKTAHDVPSVPLLPTMVHDDLNPNLLLAVSSHPSSSFSSAVSSSSSASLPLTPDTAPSLSLSPSSDRLPLATSTKPRPPPLTPGSAPQLPRGRPRLASASFFRPRSNSFNALSPSASSRTISAASPPTAPWAMPERPTSPSPLSTVTAVGDRAPPAPPPPGIDSAPSLFGRLSRSLRGGLRSRKSTPDLRAAGAMVDESSGVGAASTPPPLPQPPGPLPAMMMPRRPSDPAGKGMGMSGSLGRRNATPPAPITIPTVSSFQGRGTDASTGSFSPSSLPRSHQRAAAAPASALMQYPDPFASPRTSPAIDGSYFPLIAARQAAQPASPGLAHAVVSMYRAPSPGGGGEMPRRKLPTQLDSELAARKAETEKKVEKEKEKKKEEEEVFPFVQEQLTTTASVATPPQSSVTTEWTPPLSLLASTASSMTVVSTTADSAMPLAAAATSSQAISASQLEEVGPKEVEDLAAVSPSASYSELYIRDSVFSSSSGSHEHGHGCSSTSGLTGLGFTMAPPAVPTASAAEIDGEGGNGDGDRGRGRGRSPRWDGSGGGERGGGPNNLPPLPPGPNQPRRPSRDGSAAGGGGGGGGGVGGDTGGGGGGGGGGERGRPGRGRRADDDTDTSEGSSSTSSSGTESSESEEDDEDNEEVLKTVAPAGSDSDDDVPLAVAHPSALKVQKSLRAVRRQDHHRRRKRDKAATAAAAGASSSSNAQGHSSLSVTAGASARPKSPPSARRRNPEKESASREPRPPRTEPPSAPGGVFLSDGGGAAFHPEQLEKKLLDHLTLAEAKVKNESTTLSSLAPPPGISTPGSASSTAISRGESRSRGETVPGDSSGPYSRIDEERPQGLPRSPRPPPIEKSQTLLGVPLPEGRGSQQQVSSFSSASKPHHSRSLRRPSDQQATAAASLANNPILPVIRRRPSEPHLPQHRQASGPSSRRPSNTSSPALQPSSTVASSAPPIPPVPALPGVSTNFPVPAVSTSASLSSRSRPANERRPTLPQLLPTPSYSSTSGADSGVSPVGARSSSPMSPRPTFAVRIFVDDATTGGKRCLLVECGSTTSAKHVLELVRRSDGWKEGGSGEEMLHGAWAIWENGKEWGLERPLRDYEVLHEVQQGWNRDSLVNYFFVRRCKFSALLQIGAVANSAPNVLGQVWHRTRKGKWSKRFLEVREGGVWLSKNDRGKDEEFLCSMSAYDVYAFTIKIKSEKPRAWALKSQENSTLFEDPNDYLHVFSTDDRTFETLRRGLTSCRSHALTLSNPALFRPFNLSSSAVPGAALASPVFGSNSPGNSFAAAQQPLLTTSPLANGSQFGLLPLRSGGGLVAVAAAGATGASGEKPTDRGLWEKGSLLSKMGSRR